MKKIGVFGSCITRDAFNSEFVPNYKDFFEINISVQNSTLCSVMQESLNVSKKDIEILPLNKKTKFRSLCIYKDLNKCFLKELIEKDIDYLVIDNYLEMRMGILYFNDSIITNNDWHLHLTEFYKGIDEKLILKITENPDEYFCIWSKYCDLFFEFLELYCPNVKVIINKGRLVDKVLKKDRTTYINSDYTLKANIINPILDKLDSYIINNFDVFVLDYDFENIFADENHLWELAPIHYTKNYYHSLIEQIKNISSENLNGKYSNHSYNTEELVLKKEMFNKKLKRTYFETKLLLKNIKQSSDDKLKFYNQARIDMKNFGSKNKIEIIECNTNNLIIEHPNWFKSEEGEGIVIQNDEGCLELKLKCINKGLLKIYLRGPDIRDKNKVRFPVYIDFINLTVNGESILNDHNLVWHGTPYLFEKEVEESEILNLHIEWLPFNNSCTYKE